MSWIPRIAQAQRAAHEHAAVRDGLAGYRIKSVTPQGLAPAAVRDEYFPMSYSSKEALDSPVYGLDLNDGGIRQQTLERARDHDRMATSRSFLLRSGVGNRNGFFVVLPVYRPGQPHATLQERRDNLVGYVQGVFQTAVLIDTILGTATTPAGLDLYYFAADSAHDAPPIYFHPSRAATRSRSRRNRARRSRPACTGRARSAWVTAPGPSLQRRYRAARERHLTSARG